MNDLTRRQTTKIRNTLANNKSTDIELSKAQIFNQKMFNSANSANVAIPLAIDNLPGLASNLTSNVIKKFEKKWKRSCDSRGRVYFIYFE